MTQDEGTPYQRHMPSAVICEFLDRLDPGDYYDCGRARLLGIDEVLEKEAVSLGRPLGDDKFMLVATDIGLIYCRASISFAIAGRWSDITISRPLPRGQSGRTAQLPISWPVHGELRFIVSNRLAVNLFRRWTQMQVRSSAEHTIQFEQIQDLPNLDVTSAESVANSVNYEIDTIDLVEPLEGDPAPLTAPLADLLAELDDEPVQVFSDREVQKPVTSTAREGFERPSVPIPEISGASLQSNPDTENAELDEELSQAEPDLGQERNWQDVNNLASDSEVSSKAKETVSLTQQQQFLVKQNLAKNKRAVDKRIAGQPAVVTNNSRSVDGSATTTRAVPTAGQAGYAPIPPRINRPPQPVSRSASRMPAQLGGQQRPGRRTDGFDDETANGYVSDRYPSSASGLGEMWRENRTAVLVICLVLASISVALLAVSDDGSRSQQDPLVSNVQVKDSVPASVIGDTGQVGSGANTVATTVELCHSNYSGCVPMRGLDVDCFGTGDGPLFQNKEVMVLGSDVFDLDTDSDGVACEPDQPKEADGAVTE